jgi:hypothetical protein
MLILEPITVHQTNYEMTATDKRSLISESVAVTRIDIHPTGETPDQHIVSVTPRVSRTTTVCEVPTKSKSVPCFRDEVLPPSDTPAQPSSRCLIPPLTNHLKAGGAVRRNSYMTTRFTGPHKIWHAVSKNQRLSLGPKRQVLNRHRLGGGYHTETSE